MMGIFESIILGTAGNAVYGIIKEVLSLIFPDQNENNSPLQNDPIMKMAADAVEQTYKRFHETMGEEFGKPADCFLNNPINTKILVQHVCFGHDTIPMERFEGHGHRLEKNATGEALQFLVDTFEEEVNKNHQLRNWVDNIKERREAKEFRERMTAQFPSGPAGERAAPASPASATQGVELLTALPAEKVKKLVGRTKDLILIHRVAKKSFALSERKKTICTML